MRSVSQGARPYNIARKTKPPTNILQTCRCVTETVDPEFSAPAPAAAGSVGDGDGAGEVGVSPAVVTDAPEGKMPDGTVKETKLEVELALAVELAELEPGSVLVTSGGRLTLLEESPVW